MTRTKVFVTGGSGFLGRGILRQADNLGWDVTVFSRDEYKQDLCKRRFPDAHYILGDVLDYDSMLRHMKQHDIVIHTAAIKFIPEAEYNVQETIRVNVSGTENVLRAAANSEVRHTVVISTDKAVQPVNVYGMSKALCERLVGEYARLYPELNFNACRYGNVVGSTGSIVPVFQDQLRRNNEVTVTDPTMTRYWISVEQAVRLITNTLEFKLLSGSILIQEPASMSIGDLAELIAGDRVKIIGARPGEKKHESLLHQQESVRVRNIGGYFELLPAYAKATSEPFFLTSATPKYWLNPNTMSAMIEDSMQV